MPFVPDSTQAGYLGPESTPAPLEGDAWTDFLGDVVAGITGLDRDTAVRPRWQRKPPVEPGIDVNWVSVGISSTEAEGLEPWVGHINTGDGLDEVQRMERATLACSFYGPNADRFARYLRDGLYIDQNRAALRANDVGLIEVGNFTRTADLFKNQFRDRVDMDVVLRRAVRRQYAVRTLLSAQGTVIANDPGTRTVASDFDTTREG